MNAPTPDHYHFIILPAHYQLAYLKNRQPGLSAPQRLFTKEELARGLFFDYDEEALIAVMRRQHGSLSWAKTLMDELYDFPVDTSASSRIEMLNALFQDLKQSGLLRFDTSFKDSFVGKAALVIGYHPQDPELLKIGKSLGLKLDWQETTHHPSRTVTRCATIREEVHHVFNRISRLIEEGLPMRRISILCPDPSYDFELRLAAPYFHLPINFIGRDCHFDTAIGRRAFALFESEGAERDIADDAIRQFGLNHSHPVIQAIHEVMALPGHHHERVQFLKDRLLKAAIEPTRYQDAITQIETPYPVVNQHIFVLGASQGIVPPVRKTQGYLSDSERAAVGRLTYDLDNENEVRQWRYFFEEQKDLHISYAVGNEASNYPSPLFKVLGYDVADHRYDSVEYGGMRAEFHLATLLDQKRVYHSDSPLIGPYQARYPLPYRDYDYRYQHFDAGLGTANLSLAYTGIKTYYQCRFRYYLDYVLRLDPREDTFFIRLGNLAHELLEAMYEPGFEYEATFDRLVEAYPFTPKEAALVAGMKADLRAVVAFNQEHQTHMTNPTIATEVKAQFALDERTAFKGKLDKVIVIHSGDRRYAAIVDYKTGSETFEPQKLAHGASLQLPTYALLIANAPGYEDCSLVGFYIQSILPSSRLRETDDLKLKGRSLADPVVLGAFDDTIAHSEFIKNIALKAGDGTFYKTAPVADVEEFEHYKNIALDLIKQANQSIRSSDFTIDPKQLDRDESSCHYCPFRDVCFRPDEAVTHIKLTAEETQDGPDME